MLKVKLLIIKIPHVYVAWCGLFIVYSVGNSFAPPRGCNKSVLEAFVKAPSSVPVIYWFLMLNSLNKSVLKLFKPLTPPTHAATPADVSLLMQLGVDGVFVGSGIFKSNNPDTRARAMAQAVLHYNDPKVLAEISEDLGEAMVSCCRWWLDDGINFIYLNFFFNLI